MYSDIYKENFHSNVTKNREIESIRNSHNKSSAKSLFIKLLTNSARINFLLLYLKS